MDCIKKWIESIYILLSRASLWPWVKTFHEKIYRRIDKKERKKQGFIITQSTHADIGLYNFARVSVWQLDNDRTFRSAPLLENAQPSRMYLSITASRGSETVRYRYLDHKGITWSISVPALFKPQNWSAFTASSIAARDELANMAY